MAGLVTDHYKSFLVKDDEGRTGLVCGEMRPRATI